MAASDRPSDREPALGVPSPVDIALWRRRFIVNNDTGTAGGGGGNAGEAMGLLLLLTKSS